MGKIEKIFDNFYSDFYLAEHTGNSGGHYPTKKDVIEDSTIRLKSLILGACKCDVCRTNLEKLFESEDVL